MFMCLCYAIVMTGFMFVSLKTWGTPGHQGDSAHSCYFDKGKGGRSTLVLKF